MTAEAPPQPDCVSCRASRWTEVPGTDDSYRLFRCDACGCYRIRNSVAPSAELYDSYYSEGSAERLAGVFNVLWRWKRRSRARLILGGIRKGARVCDVGCERGELLNVLKSEGCDVAGTQISGAAAAFALRQFGIQVYVGELMDAPFAAESFDAILMLNVLEHLSDPEAYVEQAARMLPSGGIFWIEIPNSGSFTARVTGKNWLHHDPAHHFWAFDRPGIERLIGRHGFAIDRIDSDSWEFGPIGCLQSWLNFLPGRKNVVFDIVRRGLSRHAGALALELTHVFLGGWFLVPAVVVAGLERAAGNGQVILIRARKR